jgi:hypothetical protein
LSSATSAAGETGASGGAGAGGKASIGLFSSGGTGGTVLGISSLVSLDSDFESLLEFLLELPLVDILRNNDNNDKKNNLRTGKLENKLVKNNRKRFLVITVIALAGL